MTPEELLKPRYQVIADYPDNKLTIGDILMQYVENDTVWRHRWSDGHWADITVHNPSYYPHLFKKLEWWEERKPEDMPEYVKDIGDGEIFRVDKYELPKKIQVIRNGKSFHPDSPTHFVSIEHFHPATKEEYDNYINSKP